MERDNNAIPVDVTISYSKVVKKEIKWLWYPYIPCGKITLLQGDPGEGKSTFMIQLASIISNGGSLPTGQKLDSAENVVYQCAEDNLADTIKPRLDEAGADCNRVKYISDPDMDLSVVDKRIEMAINEVDAKLLILDPIQSFIPESSDMQSAMQMRNTMKKLAGVAERTGCAIVMIGHMNKAAGGKHIYRGLGSIDIAAIARSILMIVRDNDQDNCRYMIHIKSNLAPEGDAVGFSFDSDFGFRWKGVYPVSNGAVTSRSSEKLTKKEQAEEWLRNMLAYVDKPSKEIIERVSELGIGERTLRTVAKEININAYKKNNSWYWSLKPQSENKDEI